MSTEKIFETFEAVWKALAEYVLAVLKYFKVVPEDFEA